MKRLLLTAVLGTVLLGSAGMASADDDRWERRSHDRREWRDRDRYDSDGRHYRGHRQSHRHHHYHPGRGHYKPWKHHHYSRYGRHWDRYHDDGVTIIFKGRIH
ncbi:MAG: hypothetical protein IT532_05290 [Burkholderiales bacterium]|nr:hypothetical protein [Burkholderiales bacterium]